MEDSHAEARRAIRSRAQPGCPMCGNPGAVVFGNLRDHLFAVPGIWHFRRCGDEKCGFLWLDPMPVEEDLPDLYQVYFTHETRGLGGHRAGERLKEWIRRGVLQRRLGYDQDLSASIAGLLCMIAGTFPSGVDGFIAEAMFLRAPGARSRLLEIGCGNGEALARMRTLGWTVLGIDPDPKAVGLARTLGLDVRLGGIEQVAGDDGPFDAIYLGHVIEHVPDPLDLLKRCRELLRDGGALVLLTPNSASLGMRWFGPHWRGLEPPRHLSVFNPESMHSLCVRAGFAVQTLRTSARGAGYILSMSLQVKMAARSGTVVRPPSVAVRLAGYLLQGIERGAEIVRASSGEEIVVLATREASLHA